MFSQIRALAKQRFAGEGAFDPQLLTAAAVFATGASMLVGADFADGAQSLGLLAANLIAFALILFPVWVFSRKRLPRSRIPVLSLGQLMALGFLVGLAKGALTGLVMFGFGLEVDALFSVFSRVWQTSLLGLWFVPVVALFGTLRARFSEQRIALVAQANASDAGASSQPVSLVSFIERARTRLATVGVDSSGTRLSNELQQIISNDLRPLSYNLWSREFEKFPSFSLRQILSTALQEHMYYWKLVVPLWFLTTVVPTILYFGPDAGLAIQALRALALLLVFFIAARIRVTSAMSGVIVFATSILAIWLLQSLIAVWLAPASEVFTNPWLMLINLIWLFELALLSAMARAFLAMGKRVEGEYQLLAEDRRDSGFSRELALRDRQVAQFLHGHLQSQLNSAANRLALTTTPEEVERELQLLENLLREALEEFGRAQTLTLEAGLQKLVDDWGGMVEIRFLVNAEPMSPEAAEQCCEVINEAIANALRHGFATQLSVSVTPGPVVTVIDNGTGPRDGAPGLGSRFFDSVSQDWSLRPTEAGSVLTVSLR